EDYHKQEYPDREREMPLIDEYNLPPNPQVRAAIWVARWEKISQMERGAHCLLKGLLRPKELDKRRGAMEKEKRSSYASYHTRVEEQLAQSHDQRDHTYETQHAQYIDAPSQVEPKELQIAGLKIE